MRIAFAGTPIFAEIQLQALLNTAHEVVVVYTQPDRPAGRGQQQHATPVKILAQNNQIPVVQPTTLKSPDSAALLASYRPEILIVAAYGLLLPKEILTIPALGCINVHASLLPRWRGASPIQAAILAGDEETGITLMQMDLGLDTGNMLAKVACPIHQHDTAGSLHDKLALLGAKLLVDNLDNIDKLQPHPQEESLATHAGKISKEQAHLKWDLSAAEIDRTIRAFNPWPIAYSFLEEQTLRIWQAEPIELPKPGSPGTIVAHHERGIIVATGNQGLLLTKGQLPGKKCLSFSDMLHARQTLFAIGQRLQ